MFDRSYVRNTGSRPEESTMSAITWNSAPAAMPAPRPRLRITRRGRAVLAALVALPLVAAAVLGGIGAVGATATDTHATTSFDYVTVQPGESLWQLAEQLAPNADPRDVVTDITNLNALSTGVLQPGQRLAIPAQYSH
jgi:hypothetical protein